MSQREWTLIGAPLDSAGAGEGEERMPAALRAAGLVAALRARDAGDVTGLLRPAVRDPRTGLIAFDAVVSACSAVRDAVAGVLRDGGRPLVVGGDCTFLPGALAGCRVAGLGPLGLWMVDGHPDALDGASSPTGEAADMDLAIALGRGPAELTSLAGADTVPLLEPQRVAVLGLRPAGLDPGNDEDLALLPEAVWRRDAPAILAQGARAVGEEAAARLQGHAGDAAAGTSDPPGALVRASGAAGAAGDWRPAVWLHVDLDALDESVMPAVSYPQPQGLTWEALEELVAPLAASPALAGVSVSDLQADLDLDGVHARRTVELLARALPR